MAAAGGTAGANAQAHADYVGQLDEREKRILAVAREHLGDSFDLSKSIGFQAFIAKSCSYEEEESADAVGDSISPSGPEQG